MSPATTAALPSRLVSERRQQVRAFLEGEQQQVDRPEWLGGRFRRPSILSASRHRCLPWLGLLLILAELARGRARRQNPARPSSRWGERGHDRPRAGAKPLRTPRLVVQLERQRVTGTSDGAGLVRPAPVSHGYPLRQHRRGDPPWRELKPRHDLCVPRVGLEGEPSRCHPARGDGHSRRPSGEATRRDS